MSRSDQAEQAFLGEGHRKVRAQLRANGNRVAKNRVLRLMRESGAPRLSGVGHPRGDRSHSGRITTDAPNELWGTNATRFYTKADGWCWFFVAVDHCVTDIVGWYVAKKGDGWTALEPIRQDMRTHMDGYAPKIALGLGLRHDWGPQYPAHQFQGELRWAGIRSTAAYVGEPECNGVAERFIRTLKVPVPPRLREPRGGEKSSQSSSSATTAGGSWNGTGTGPRPRSARSSPSWQRD